MDAFDIAEVARRTGLSSRALRFYEARGLISPLRTASGRRLFGASEMARVHQLIILKRAGFTLADIKRLFDNKALDLDALLRAQIAAITDQFAKLEEAHALLRSALSRIDAGERLDAATFCSLIQNGDIPMNKHNMDKVVSQYWSPAAKMQYGVRFNEMFTGFSPEQYQQRWTELSARISAALPCDPASDEALGFVREWLALLESFTKVATKEMWDSASNMYQNMDKWQDTVSPGFDKKVWDFIQTASKIAREAGHDVGPLPSWMTP
jgi:DNA-binding transcriptional MerR regulator